MTIRYMGTKKYLAQDVHDTIQASASSGAVVDLFAGMGTVAETFADDRNVVLNDAFDFVGCIARARFTGGVLQQSPAGTFAELNEVFASHIVRLRARFEGEIEAERVALSSDRLIFGRHVDKSNNVSNSAAKRREAATAATTSDSSRYCLATLYFSGGYFSLEQAIHIDAIRAAIDARGSGPDRDLLLRAWLSTVSTVLNAPGHSAQFFRPNSDAALSRIKRSWSRSVLEEFQSQLGRSVQVGSEQWRKGNRVYTSDALRLPYGDALDSAGVVYADPPYTRDQYSRFYHLFETLFRYDFPDAAGRGRNRADGFLSEFSKASKVESAFHSLCREVKARALPLVISYPSNGLLCSTGASVEGVARQYFRSVTTKSKQAIHSTLGASSGASKVGATECLITCLP